MLGACNSQVGADRNGRRDEGEQVTQSLHPRPRNRPLAATVADE